MVNAWASEILQTKCFGFFTAALPEQLPVHSQKIFESFHKYKALQTNKSLLYCALLEYQDFH